MLKYAWHVNRSGNTGMSADIVSLSLLGSILAIFIIFPIGPYLHYIV